MCSVELSEEVLRCVEIAEKFLVECRELIDKDPIQASEKLYEAAEEVVKTLAVVLNLPEARKAIESSGWWSKLLEKAVQGCFGLHNHLQHSCSLMSKAS
jgi:hypothetical protein